MAQVAETLLGAPNARLSRDQNPRYGTNGSLHIDLATGTFYDHESKSGGGVLDLIARETGRDKHGAVEWMREHGMIEPDIAPLNGKRASMKEVAHYGYTDENDDLIFQVVRYEPKRFLQRRRDETGAWTWKVAGARQVPYRLPALIEAIAEDKTIFIVEGEKDADNLAKWNIPATCNAGGVGKWKNEFAEFFRDADVVIIPDNDDAGRDHANQVAAALAPVARRVRILALPALPVKGDFTDWSVGKSPEAFHSLVEKAPEWNAKPFVSKFRGLRWEEIGSDGTVGYTWLIEDIVPLGEITLVYGDSGSGKSFNVFDMGMCIARGLPFNGRNVEQGLVVYVAAEAGKGFAKRKTAYMIQHKLERSKPPPFFLIPERPDFFLDDADAVALIEYIKSKTPTYNEPLVLIVLDTLSALAPGMNENASADVSMVRKRLMMMQVAFPGAAIVLVHHKPKGGSTPRGHGSLTADFETTIEFETLADRHRATVRKQREGRAGIEWQFTLPVVELGRNKWGNPETSCVVASTKSERKQAIGFHATPTEMLFMRSLYEALVDYPSPPPAGLPVTITKVVEQRHVRVRMREQMIPSHEDSSIADGRFRVAFKRAGDKLRDGAVIGIQGNLLWPTGKPVNGLTTVPVP